MTSRTRPKIKRARDGTVIAELPLPDPRKYPRGHYSKLEVIEYVVLYGMKAAIRAINEAKCYQKRRSLQKFFPRGG